MTTLGEMFDDQDTRPFEERVAEVVAIVAEAADFAGVDYGLRAMFEAICSARDEDEFDRVYDQLVMTMSENTSRVLQGALPHGQGTHTSIGA
jgi:hypothetical protein